MSKKDCPYCFMSDNEIVEDYMKTKERCNGMNGKECPKKALYDKLDPPKQVKPEEPAPDPEPTKARKFAEKSTKQDEPSETNYLTFLARKDSTVMLNWQNYSLPKIEYSFDNETWESFDVKPSVKLPSGKKMMLRGKNPNGLAVSMQNYTNIKITGLVEASGSVMSIVDNSGDTKEIPTDYCFARLFENSDGLITAPELPATSLKKGCYAAMFKGCSNLSLPPSLPASKLADECYAEMFSECKVLIKAPTLHANKNNLGKDSYSKMFHNCKSISQKPEMPLGVMNVELWCSMLYGCGFLSYIEKQPNKNLLVIVSGIPFIMVYVEGGTFTMGCTSEQGIIAPSNEMPHEVTLSSYYIGETQITQDLWREVMRDVGNPDPSSFKGDKNPVERISWVEAKSFAATLSNLTGLKFDLPTEAQWEYAARGGKHCKAHNYKYSGSNIPDDVAWYNGNSGNKTHPVKDAAISSNALGIYDMSGNVWEWCRDVYNGNFYSSSESRQKDPECTSGSSYRVLRGGSWFNNADDARVSLRCCIPGYGNYNVGLRLVCGSLP